jgi:hypothetical protein
VFRFVFVCNVFWVEFQRYRGGGGDGGGGGGGGPELRTTDKKVTGED